jgi:hypothetical protein
MEFTVAGGWNQLTRAQEYGQTAWLRPLASVCFVCKYMSSSSESSEESSQAYDQRDEHQEHITSRKERTKRVPSTLLALDFLFCTTMAEPLPVDHEMTQCVRMAAQDCADRGLTAAAKWCIPHAWHPYALIDPNP